MLINKPNIPAVIMISQKLHSGRPPLTCRPRILNSTRQTLMPLYRTIPPSLIMCPMFVPGQRLINE
ncbi:hypothetical protein DERP_004910 [Dermatophagoides pteronyssinus]|uniref:Uncharacterized protein n=1 Tax=Dermatophagoides pteronyssinus TaxID=6956 RepID=A0ABQ8JSV2_DERPT|nr:hypothetical protein DERP_004910 [Dermatophagoides pteronyssinus]